MLFEVCILLLVHSSASDGPNSILKATESNFRKKNNSPKPGTNWQEEEETDNKKRWWMLIIWRQCKEFLDTVLGRQSSGMTLISLFVINKLNKYVFNK